MTTMQVVFRGKNADHFFFRDVTDGRDIDPVDLGFTWFMLVPPDELPT